MYNFRLLQGFNFKVEWVNIYSIKLIEQYIKA